MTETRSLGVNAGHSELRELGLHPASPSINRSDGLSPSVPCQGPSPVGRAGMFREQSQCHA